MSRSFQIINALLGALVFSSFVDFDAADHHEEHQRSRQIIPQLLTTDIGEGSLLSLDCRSGIQTPLHLAQWFKTVDGQEKEFYRFNQTASPQKQYPVTVSDVRVDVLESDANSVALYDVNEATGGLFTCVYSAEFPTPDTLLLRSSFELSVGNPVPITLTQRVSTNWLTVECEVDERADQTYAYKWYKDGAEFYRSVPWSSQQTQTVTPVPNVSVDLPHSNGSHVAIKNFTPQSSGQYKCAASTNVPNTRTLVFKINLEQS